MTCTILGEGGGIQCKYKENKMCTYKPNKETSEETAMSHKILVSRTETLSLSCLDDIL